MPVMLLVKKTNQIAMFFPRINSQDMNHIYDGNNRTVEEFSSSRHW